MKAILVLLVFLVSASSAFADVLPSAQESGTAEGIAIGASVMLASANVMTSVAGVPNNVIAGLSVVAGLAAFSFAMQDQPPFELGLWASGASAIATGLIAARYRYVLDHQGKHARLEPAWTNQAPGLAFVVDF